MENDGRESVTVGEFSRWTNSFEHRIDAHFEHVNEKLDKANGRLVGHGERIAILEDRQTRSGRRAGLGGAGVAGAFVAVVELVKSYFGK
mgnify:CR=1 FL=1